MKPGGTEHPKVRHLARALGVPVYSAVGLLELLFSFTGRYRPRGDVGNFSDADLADAVTWDGDAEKLVAALQSTKWLDAVDEPERLVVHDWSEHATDAVNMRLARARELFADGTIPKRARLPKPERDRADAYYRPLENKRLLGSVRTESARRVGSPLPPSHTSSLPIPALKNPCARRAHDAIREARAGLAKRLQREPTEDELLEQLRSDGHADLAAHYEKKPEEDL